MFMQFMILMFFEGIGGGSKQSFICLDTAPATIFRFMTFFIKSYFYAALFFSVTFILSIQIQDNNVLLKVKPNKIITTYQEFYKKIDHHQQINSILLKKYVDGGMEEKKVQEQQLQQQIFLIQLKQFQLMLKTKNSFFTPSKRQDNYLEIKRESSEPSKHFFSVKMEKNRLSENKVRQSATLMPKRMSTSDVATRKNSEEANNKRFFHHRQQSEIKSIFRRKTTSSAFIRTKTDKTQTNSQNLNTQHIIHSQFFSKVEEIEQEYLQNYCNEKYQQAGKVLIKILNYTIDFNLMGHFLRTIKQLAQFYRIINKNNFALFYFDQSRQCSFQLNDPQILIDSLIGCSLCCRKEEMFQESILFLKKSLEFCWYHNKTQQQLRIYDQYGKVYYLMGELEKANSFHDKFINAILEPENSPQRALSKQRILKLYQEDNSKTYESIDIIFLSSLCLPILSHKQLPPLPGCKENLRSNFDISTKYFSQIAEIKRLVSKILGQTFFSTEMQQPETPHLHKSVSASFKNNRKIDFIDFKMKQYLRELGIGYKSKIELKPKNLEYRQPLDEKVKKKLKQPGLDPDWQFKLVREIKRDRQNKLFKVHSQIRVRGKNRVVRPEIDHIRKIFIPLYR